MAIKFPHFQTTSIFIKPGTLIIFWTLSTMVTSIFNEIHFLGLKVAFSVCRHTSMVIWRVRWVHLSLVWRLDVLAIIISIMKVCYWSKFGVQRTYDRSIFKKLEVFDQSTVSYKKWFLTSILRPFKICGMCLCVCFVLCVLHIVIWPSSNTSDGTNEILSHFLVQQLSVQK